ncbi:MAG TPA: hypothetical protein VFN64_04875 [Burkholderiaceae bacterium]|nr:hypothetical protein [Burkholderiaceae bacterium]
MSALVSACDRCGAVRRGVGGWPCEDGGWGVDVWPGTTACSCWQCSDELRAAGYRTILLDGRAIAVRIDDAAGAEVPTDPPRRRAIATTKVK